MISSIQIRNFALIDSLEIELGEGFTVITGETGAGKSIFLQALSLVFGQRSDSSAVLDKSRKCIVEVTFETSDGSVEHYLETQDFDSTGKVILRREIGQDGRSRAFINDSPATLVQLKELSGMLVDVHSQHESLSIGSGQYQMNLVDGFAGHAEILSRYKGLFFRFSSLKQEIEKLKEQHQKLTAEEGYYRAMLEELEQTKIQVGEISRLESEWSVLENAEKIKSELSNIQSMLLDGDGSSAILMKESLNRLQSLSRIFPPAEEITQRLQAALIEIKDIGEEIASRESKLELNPSKGESVSARISSINQLLMKHRVKDEAGLKETEENFKSRIEQINNLEEKIQELDSETSKLTGLLNGLAVELAKGRRKAIPDFQSRVQKQLMELELPGSQFEVNIAESAALTEAGKDEVGFLFSGNQGVPLRAVGMVASGGEVSRLVLAVKTTVGSHANLEAMIFDEIDTGISGETAVKVGQALKLASHSQQVICITHLPAIAAMGDHHFLVYKTVTDEKTITRIRKAGEGERPAILARMMGGENAGKGTLASAREMLAKRK